MVRRRAIESLPAVRLLDPVVVVDGLEIPLAGIRSDGHGGQVRRRSVSRKPAERAAESSLTGDRKSRRGTRRDGRGGARRSRAAPSTHRSTGRSAFGSIRHIRTRPTFSDLTSPLVSSTWRCWITAGSDIGRGRASSLTEAVPRLSRSTMTRRFGSASAWRTRSTGCRRWANWLGIHLTIIGNSDGNTFVSGSRPRRAGPAGPRTAGPAPSRSRRSRAGSSRPSRGRSASSPEPRT